MFRFRDSRRVLRYAIACLPIAAAAFIAHGQTPATNTGSLADMTPAARAEANQGIDAFKSAHYDEAIAHFQRAVELDPDSILAKSYLGSALSENVVPGVQSPENLETAQRAIDASG